MKFFSVRLTRAKLLGGEPLDIFHKTFFVHLTDLHFQHADHPQARRQVETLRNLEAAIQSIAELPRRPDFVLFTGDIADFGDLASYRLVEETLSKLNLPVFYVLGNKDDRTGFHTAQGSLEDDPEAPHYFDTLVSGVHLIGLDSLVPGRVGGTLDAVQLGFLEEALARHPGVAKIVALHHPPVLPKFPGRRFQALDAASSQRLGQVLEGADVAAVFCGHIHLNRIVHWQGVPVVSNCGLQGAADPGFEGLRFTTQTGFALHEMAGSDLSTHFVHLEPVADTVRTFTSSELEAFDEA